VTRIQKNGKWKFEFFDEIAALILGIDADGEDFRSCGFELLVVSGQTGQLLAAVRSPVAAIKNQHDFFARIILERNRRARRRRQTEGRRGVSDLRRRSKRSHSHKKPDCESKGKTLHCFSPEKRYSRLAACGLSNFHAFRASTGWQPVVHQRLLRGSRLFIYHIRKQNYSRWSNINEHFAGSLRISGLKE
jgi:hypothetical protein